MPEVLPDEVTKSLDDLGGLETLSEMVPRREDLTEAVSAYKAMADGLRLQVLHLLAISPLCVCVIRSIMGVENSRLSYHLSILTSAGLITANKKGNWIIYTLSENGSRLLRTCSTG